MNCPLRFRAVVARRAPRRVPCVHPVRPFCFRMGDSSPIGFCRGRRAIWVAASFTWGSNVCSRLLSLLFAQLISAIQDYVAGLWHQIARRRSHSGASVQPRADFCRRCHRCLLRAVLHDLRGRSLPGTHASHASAFASTSARHVSAALSCGQRYD